MGLNHHLAVPTRFLNQVCEKQMAAMCLIVLSITFDRHVLGVSHAGGRERATLYGARPTVLANWFVVLESWPVMVSRNCIPSGPRWFQDARHRVWQTAPRGAAVAY
jgi:hypothetical protein